MSVSKTFIVLVSTFLTWPNWSNWICGTVNVIEPLATWLESAVGPYDVSLEIFVFVSAWLIVVPEIEIPEPFVYVVLLSSHGTLTAKYPLASNPTP